MPRLAAELHMLQQHYAIQEKSKRRPLTFVTAHVWEGVGHRLETVMASTVTFRTYRWFAARYWSSVTGSSQVVPSLFPVPSSMARWHMRIAQARQLFHDAKAKTAVFPPQNLVRHAEQRHERRAGHGIRESARRPGPSFSSTGPHGLAGDGQIGDHGRNRRRSAVLLRIRSHWTSWCAQAQSASAGVHDMLAQGFVVDVDQCGPGRPGDPGQYNRGLHQPTRPGFSTRQQCHLTVDQVVPFTVGTQHLTHAWVPGKDSEHGPIPHSQGDVAAEHVLRSGMWRAQGFSSLDDRPQLDEHWLDHRAEKLLARAEVVVDGRLGDPQLVGDHLQRRAREAVSSKQIDGYVDETLPRIGSTASQHCDCVHLDPLTPAIPTDSTVQLVDETRCEPYDRLVSYLTID